MTGSEIFCKGLYIVSRNCISESMTLFCAENERNGRRCKTRVVFHHQKCQIAVSNLALDVRMCLRFETPSHPCGAPVQIVLSVCPSIHLYACTFMKFDTGCFTKICRPVPVLVIICQQVRAFDLFAFLRAEVTGLVISEWGIPDWGTFLTKGNDQILANMRELLHCALIS